MREAIRRILWFVPTLVFITVIAFGAIAGTFERHAALPIFFNEAPRDVSVAAWSLARKIAAPEEVGETERNEAKRQLVTLGAAALPHVIPRLDALSPDSRRRVALSLMPLARRMGITDAQHDLDAAAALRFWLRYWDNHSIDFRAVTVRRTVKRYASRATPQRRRELYSLDTFALPELIDELAKAEDGKVVTRLAKAAGHVTELDWQLPSSGAHQAVLDPKELANRWQAWWAHHEPQYSSPQGFARLLSPVLQTQYADWAREAARTRFGLMSSGDRAWPTFRDAVPYSISLVLLGLLGGSLLGIASLAVSRLSPELPPRLQKVLLGTGLVCAVGSLQALATGSPLRELDAGPRFVSAACIVVFWGSLIAGRHQRGALARLQSADWVRTYRAQGVSPARLTWLQIHHTAGGLLMSMSSRATTIVSIVLIVEYALQLEGLGRYTFPAFKARDTTWLMLLTLATTTLLSLTQLIAHLLSSLLHPWRTHPSRRSQV